MKYGQSLRAQSTPQWAPSTADNIDYDELKNTIKVHTSKNQCRAVTIPGQADKSLEPFEKHFFTELSNQHDRVDLFVKSKVDEIDFRLQILRKQVIKLISACAEVTAREESISSRRLEKFAKYDTQIERCGDEIKCLEKFISAQRVAFHKIIKKFTKWTGSGDLAERFYDEILGSPKSFVRRDLDPLIQEYMKILKTLRDAYPDLDELKIQKSLLQDPKPIINKIKSESQPQLTYWNEYDDGSEVENEPYLVYIDPDSDSFPGAKKLAYVYSKAENLVDEVKKWLAPVQLTAERRPLLYHINDMISEQESTIDTEGEEDAFASYSEIPRGYSTFYTSSYLKIGDESIEQTRESFLLHSILGCYAASLTLLLISYLLAATGKKRLQTEIDVGVVVGVIASILFAAIGSFLLWCSRQELSWTYRFYACATFTLTCFWNGILLIQVVGEG
ncbi:putative spx domain-containing protein [Golovinomyces cichoracearum]|uniref:Putative spx domain-containing protein n=1 Tax=Golovinomyces cichoracearum TaxID=62708 RepID=A0A420IMH7_9PEZI|nr:putative spx domain-containing protein [Golovinomyces cichoracearum]